MRSKRYLATVHMIVEADNVHDACDAVGELLRGPTIDWSYLEKKDGSFQLPEPVELPQNYLEGDFRFALKDQLIIL